MPSAVSLPFSTRAPLGLTAGWVWFTLAVAPLVPMLGLYASATHGVSGWIAASGAVGVCWVAGMLALAIVARSRGLSAVSGMLLAMLIRLGGPIVVGIAIDSRGGPLAEAGFFGLVVVSYLATLVVETLLMVRMVQSSASAGGVACSVASGVANDSSPARPA